MASPSFATPTRWSSSAPGAVAGFIRARKPAQRRPPETGGNPPPAQVSAEALVEPNRRHIPSEHGPLHTAASLSHGDVRQRRHQLIARPLPSMARPDEDIFDVQRGARDEGGVCKEVHCHPYRCLTAPANQRAKIGTPAKAVAADGRPRGIKPIQELFVPGQAPQHRKDCRDIANGPRSNSKRLGHQSRHLF